MAYFRIFRTAILFMWVMMSGQSWAHEKGDLVAGLFSLRIETALNEKPIAFASGGFEIPNVSLSVASQSMPAIGLTYFITDNIAIESYLGVPPRYQIDINGLDNLAGLAQNAEVAAIDKVASTKILAALAFLQYYYGIPNTPFTLHVGLGVGYAVFTSIDVDALFFRLDNNLTFNIDSSLAGAIQLGVEVDLGDKLTGRLSYGKMKLEADAQFTTGLASLNGPPIDFTTTITVDPDIWMVGIGYEF